MSHDLHEPTEAGPMTSESLPPWGALCDADGSMTGVVEHVAVEVEVDGLAVRSRWRVRVRNRSAGPIDAIYLAPLPAGAAIVDAVARFGDRTFRADLAERAAARAVYEAAVADGRRAALFEADRREVFTMTLGRVAPGEHPELELVLVGTLDVDDGIGAVRLPLVVAPRYTSGQGGSASGGSVRGPSHDPDGWRVHAPRTADPARQVPVELALAWSGSVAAPRANVIGADVELVEGRWTVRWAGPAARDVVVRAPVGGAPDRALAIARPGGGHLVRVDLLSDAAIAPIAAVGPTAAAPLGRPRDVAVLLDRSGSMGGWKMAAAQRLAARLVDALSAADRVVVIGFDDAIERSDPALATADATVRRRLGRFVESLTARGGTELDRAVIEAGSVLHHDGVGRDKVLVLVTDAQVSAEAATRNAVASVLGDAQLYVVGIDEAVNAGLCRDLAALGGGRFDLVTRPEEVTVTIERIVHRVGRPLARSLHIAGAPAGGLLPRHGADRYAGAPTTLWAAVDADPTGATIAVEGETPDGPWRRSLTVGTASDGLLHQQSWAVAELTQLELEADLGAVDAAERAVAISLAARVLCRYTAFIAVDHAGERVPGPSRPVVQPLAEVHGWAGGAMTVAAASAPSPVAAGPATAAARPSPKRRGEHHAAGPLRVAFTSAATPERSGPPIVAIPPARPPVPGSISAALRRRVLAVLDELDADRARGRWSLAELLEDLDTFEVPEALREALERLTAVLADPAASRQGVTASMADVRAALQG
ncbi:MAG: VWA domain-containing protein [Acidimicrobiales bacterium]|nr:VWA domain-containing protein [Acidimicrobiales bacterium]